MPEAEWKHMPDATLHWDGSTGFLYFKSPENGENHCVPVTTGPSLDREVDGRLHPLWHIEINDNRAIVSPSIHYVNHFHSPNPVEFHLTEITNAD